MRLLKLFFVTVVLTLTAMTAFAMDGGKAPAASKAMVMVYVSPGAVSDVTQTQQILGQGLEKYFADKAQFFMPLDESQSIMEQYMIEHDLTPTDTEHSRGFLPKKQQLQDMAIENGVDTIIFVNARITDEKVKAAWLAFAGYKYEVTTLFTLMVYDRASDKVVHFSQKSVKENAAGTSSTERAFNKCCVKYIKELAVKY